MCGSVPKRHLHVKPQTEDSIVPYDVLDTAWTESGQTVHPPHARAPWDSGRSGWDSLSETPVTKALVLRVAPLLPLLVLMVLSSLNVQVVVEPQIRIGPMISNIAE